LAIGAARRRANLFANSMIFWHNRGLSTLGKWLAVRWRRDYGGRRIGIAAGWLPPH